MRTREELAWVAGFVEADGCFSTSRLKTRAGKIRDRRYPCVAVGQIDREVLDRIQSFLGLGLIHYTNPPHLHFRANGLEKTQAIIAMLWPFMGTVKKAQATRVLEEANR